MHLFVILKDDMELTDNLRQKIRKKIRYGASPRHVPSQIIQVDDIPRTKSGKIAELAVKDIIHGKKVNNKNALANPECLKLFKNLPEIRV